MHSEWSEHGHTKSGLITWTFDVIISLTKILLNALYHSICIMTILQWC